VLGDTTVTLYNQDITNVVYCSYQQWFAPGQGNSIPIQPLGSVTISAKRTIYVAALAAVQPLLVLPEGSQVQPSPAQIAAQINALGLAKETTQQTGNTLIDGVNTTLGAPAQDGTVGGLSNSIPTNISTTGVPLLTKSAILGSAAAQALAGTSTVTLLNAVAHTQIGYEFSISLQQSSVVATYPLLAVTLTWSDSATGRIVTVDKFYTTASNTVSTAPIVTVGTGPSKGDTLTVTLQNVTATPVTYSFVAAQNSRVYTRDSWQWVGYKGQAGTVTISGPNFGPTFSESESNLLMSWSGVLINGAVDLIVIPLYAGQVWLHVDESGVSPANFVAEVQTQSALGAADIYNSEVGGGVTGTTSVNVPIALPRSPCLLVFTNNGSVNATIDSKIIISEQAG
jgi:hypothetical protein